MPLRKGRWSPFSKLSHKFGDNLSPDDAYLSYYDVRLTREDVDCIKDDWLTDNVIAFWEEYLEHEKLSHYPRANIVLLRPSMAFMLLNAADPRQLRSALPDFSHTTHVFLPVNDCTDVNRAEGGSHWSLLVVSLLDRVAFHYDSLSPHNMRDGELLTNRLSQLLSIPLRFADLPDAPRQLTGIDCGVYVCMLIRHLLGRLLSESSRGKLNMSMAGLQVDAQGARKEMLDVIEIFRKEGERRRSESGRRSSSISSKHDPSRSPPRIGEENSPAREH